jgi:hypothetical protein
MKGLVYGGPGVPYWTEIPDPGIRDPRDVIIQIVAGQLDLGHMVTHRFGLGDFMEAYDVFSDPAHSGALKVVLSR